MCCQSKGHSNKLGMEACNCGCGCGTEAPMGFQRMFYSKQERKEQLENYLKKLQAEIEEVEKRLKHMEEK